MANKQKLSEIVVNNVIAFIKPFASKTLQKAVSILLKPCCDIIATVEATCNDDNTYAIVVTTVESINFLGNGVATLVVDGTSLTGVITEPNTIFVETATLTAGTYDVDVTLLLPTNTSGSVGAFKTFTVADVVFASCV